MQDVSTTSHIKIERYRSMFDENRSCESQQVDSSR